MPEQHKDAFKSACQKTSESLFQKLVDLLPQAQALSPDDVINLNDAWKKNKLFLKLLDDWVDPQSPVYAYLQDSHALNALILLNTPAEYSSSNLSAIFAQFDENYRDITQQIQARFKILTHVSFNNKERLLTIIDHLIDRHGLKEMVEGALVIDESLAGAMPTLLPDLINHLVAKIFLENNLNLFKLRRYANKTFLFLIILYSPAEFTRLMHQLLSDTSIDFEQHVKPLLQIQNSDGLMVTALHCLANSAQGAFGRLMSQLLSDTSIDFEQRVKPLLERQDNIGSSLFRRLPYPRNRS